MGLFSHVAPTCRHCGEEALSDKSEDFFDGDGDLGSLVKATPESSRSSSSSSSCSDFLSPSWSSLECPESLLVSLSESESSSLAGAELGSGSFDSEVEPWVEFCSSFAAEAAAMMCWPKENMETRLVIWSISITECVEVGLVGGDGDLKDDVTDDEVVGDGGRKAGWRTA